MMTQPTVEQKTALKMAACIAAHNGSFLEEQRVAEDLQNARRLRLQGSIHYNSCESPQQGDMASKGHT